jgi:hypothetical protein
LAAVGKAPSLACGRIQITTFDDYRKFVREIATADSLTMYEGLPGDFGEPELRKAELAKNIHVEIDGHEFYRGGKSLDAQEAAEMTRLFSKEGVAVAYGGAKTCGGFHPDFMAEWTVVNEKYRAHVCFGCHEIMAIGPGIDTLTDISDSHFPVLEKALLRYRDKRPASSR